MKRDFTWGLEHRPAEGLWLEPKTGRGNVFGFDITHETDEPLLPVFLARAGSIATRFLLPQRWLRSEGNAVPGSQAVII